MLRLEKYSCAHARRGRCVVINNQHFAPNSGMPNRDGSEVDAMDVCREFATLGFDVHRFDNLTDEEMRECLTKGIAASWI